MNEKIFCIILLIFILNINLIGSFENSEKVDAEVYQNLEDNVKTKVIVELKEPASEKGLFIKTKKTNDEIESEKQDIKENIEEKIGEKIRHDFGNEIAIEVSKEDLIELNINPNVQNIKIDVPVKAFLQDSVPLINASSVWPVKISGFNITGIDETVCILDTGINFSHTDLIGKNKTCVIDCVGKSCVENCSIADDNGHGTHVAGIVAANNGIRGVAVGVGLISVKVLDSAGEGSSSDIDAGISWCIENSANYNISVISMSLGTDCDLTPQYCYNVYCDYDWTSTVLRINNATSRNISVIIATGNDGNKQNISAPACINNATAVASTDKSDNIASYSNRNNLTDLLAPGSSINSTKRDGTYFIQSGTSMATPHVAGAFVIAREFFRLQNNRVPKPSEIEAVLNNTGKQINDTGGKGLNFSRIDIYSALISMDSSNPVVNLTSPANATVRFNTNISFRCSASDVLLLNLTFYVWNSSGIYNTTTRQTIGVNANEEFNLTLDYNSYIWNCLAYDSKGNFSFASNYSLIATKLLINQNYPSNNSYVNQNQTFNCSAETESSNRLANMTFYAWNSSRDLIFNLSYNVSGISNYSLFNYSFANETSYYWNCRAYNNNSNQVFGNNFTITYDITKPNITLLSPSDSSSYSSNSQSIIFSYNVSDNFNIGNCSLIINDKINLTNSSITNLSESQSITQTFAPGNYNWSINCSDSAGNTENSSKRIFTISSPPAIASSSGGGSGVFPSATYTPNISETSKGYTKELNKNEKIQFVFFDATTMKHTLTINEIKTDYVNITIKSNSINLILGIGQSVKLNLSSPNYYDLFVKLDSIENNKAKITIQTIHEEIPRPLISNIINESEDDRKNKEEIEIAKNIEDLNYAIKIMKIFFFAIVIIFIIIIAVLLLIKRRTKDKKERTNEKKSSSKKKPGKDKK
jgi:subtilisin family serine protease